MTNLCGCGQVPVNVIHNCAMTPGRFTTKDSGKREEFSSGMVRDTQDDKPRYDLVDPAMEMRVRLLLHIYEAELSLLLWLNGNGDGSHVIAHLAMIGSDPESFFRDWAALMGRGAKKYGAENWRKAAGVEELTRFKASAKRHFYQYKSGNTDEDHRSAVAFNVAGAEMVKDKLAIESADMLSQGVDGGMPS